MEPLVSFSRSPMVNRTTGSSRLSVHGSHGMVSSSSGPASAAVEAVGSVVLASSIWTAVFIRTSCPCYIRPVVGLESLTKPQRQRVEQLHEYQCNSSAEMGIVGATTSRARLV